MANSARARTLSRLRRWSHAGHQGLNSRRQVYLKWAWVSWLDKTPFIKPETQNNGPAWHWEKELMVPTKPDSPPFPAEQRGWEGFTWSHLGREVQLVVQEPSRPSTPFFPPMPTHLPSQAGYWPKKIRFHCKKSYNSESSLHHYINK